MNLIAQIEAEQIASLGKTIPDFKAGDTVRVASVQIGVNARQMTTNSDGVLVDRDLQDPTDVCYQFAAKFTELYPLICKHYPCFERIKTLYASVALAKFIHENRVPVTPSARPPPFHTCTLYYSQTPFHYSSL